MNLEIPYLKKVELAVAKYRQIAAEYGFQVRRTRDRYIITHGGKAIVGYIDTDIERLFRTKEGEASLRRTLQYAQSTDGEREHGSA